MNIFSKKQNRSTEGCSKLKRSVDMTSSGKNGLNIRTNASPKWDRTRCPECNQDRWVQQRLDHSSTVVRIPHYILFFLICLFVTCLNRQKC